MLGINDCDQCNKPVECAAEGLSLQNYEMYAIIILIIYVNNDVIFYCLFYNYNSQVSGSLLTCAVQFNNSRVNLTDIAV